MPSTETTRPTLAAADTSDRTLDLVAIRAVIADIEEGVNGNDVPLAVEHFAADALVVNAAGGVATGWAGVVAAHEAAFAGFLKDQHVEYQVEEITFVRPDVAIVLKSARATDAEGRLLDADPAMRAVYTLVRQDDVWWIASRANTPVVR